MTCRGIVASRFVIAGRLLVAGRKVQTGGLIGAGRLREAGGRSRTRHGPIARLCAGACRLPLTRVRGRARCCAIATGRTGTSHRPFAALRSHACRVPLHRRVQTGRRTVASFRPCAGRRHIARLRACTGVCAIQRSQLRASGARLFGLFRMRFGRFGGVTLRFRRDVDILEFLNRGLETMLEERRWLRIRGGENVGDEHERYKQSRYYRQNATSRRGSSSTSTGTLHDPPPGLMRKTIKFPQTTTVMNIEPRS